MEAKLLKLNLKLIIFSIISFFIFLGVLNLLPVFYVPIFSPVPVIFLVYAAVFILSWARFSKRNKKEPLSFKDTALGSAPLFTLSATGYLWAIYTITFGDFEANDMLNVGVMLSVFTSTLILFAGIFCFLFFKIVSKKSVK